MAISIQPVSGFDVTLDSPSEAYVGEEFTAEISADANGEYDVKIFVHSSPDEKISSDEYISEIYDDGWKNPWYYLKESYPDQKSYEIRVTSSPGTREICGRLRDPDSKDYYTECNRIKILENEDYEEESKDEEKEEEEPAGREYDEELPDSIQSVQKSTEQNSETLEINPKEQQEKFNEMIILNSPEPKDQPIILQTKTGKQKEFVIYGFMAFCLVIILLLALRRL